ncbi:MAG: hypothetical protein HFE64_03195 [Lachnospiraceae bacterium]|jgi:hypothetical protein|nr:hypothetical protein [Lachnospiraceae bacterium]
MSKFLTDEQVQIEIDQLNESPAVALARQEQRLKYRKRQYLYVLRWYEKRGKELMAAGITYEAMVEDYNRLKQEDGVEIDGSGED